jgi:hypothetical protein
MKTLTVADNYATMLIPGTILWRPVHMFDVGLSECAESQPVHFKESDRSNQYMTRLSLIGNLACWEPTITNGKGIVVFVDEKPPENWTHLVVLRCSSRMKEPIGTSQQVQGCSVFAMPKVMPNFNRLMAQLGKLRFNNTNAEIEDVVDISSSVQAELGVGEHRLVITPNYYREQQPTPIYDYCHLKS